MRSRCKLGVQVKTGVMVNEIDKEGIVFAAHNGAGTDHRLDARTVIWAGGVTVPAWGVYLRLWVSKGWPHGQALRERDGGPA